MPINLGNSLKKKKSISVFRTTVVKDFEFILEDEYGSVDKRLTNEQ